MRESVYDAMAAPRRCCGWRTPGTSGCWRTLLDRFHRGVELMYSHPDTPDDVPEDLPLPRWSWNGPVDP